MKIRAALDVNGESQSLTYFSILQETFEHLALKLAAFLFFFNEKPIIINAAQQHDALQGQEFAPDLLAVDDSGQARLWVECGSTTLHKLEKVSKRFRDCRILVLTAHPREGRALAESLDKADVKRIEIWAFAEKEFARWQKLVAENNTIIGEVSPTELNLVMNEEMFMTALERIQ